MLYPINHFAVQSAALAVAALAVKGDGRGD